MGQKNLGALYDSLLGLGIMTNVADLKIQALMMQIIF